MNRLNFLNMRIRMFISSYFPLYVILLILYRDKIKKTQIISWLDKYINI